ncbi:MAG: hypothetical protein KHY62_02230 [Firmicutes bacterium]|nr:hypothetical protein [Bacillota bacterium]
MLDYKDKNLAESISAGFCSFLILRSAFYGGDEAVHIIRLPLFFFVFRFFVSLHSILPYF